MKRPTAEEIQNARAMLVDVATMNGKAIVDDGELDAIRVLLATTEPQDNDPAIVRALENEFAEGRSVEL